MPKFKRFFSLAIFQNIHIQINMGADICQKKLIFSQDCRYASKEHAEMIFELKK